MIRRKFLKLIGLAAPAAIGVSVLSHFETAKTPTALCDLTDYTGRYPWIPETTVPGSYRARINGTPLTVEQIRECKRQLISRNVHPDSEGNFYGFYNGVLG